MWQDDVTPNKSLKEEGWKHKESETPGTESPKESATLETEVSEASELQSPVDLACPMRQESEGFWRPVDLACPVMTGRVKASGSPVELACHHPAIDRIVKVLVKLRNPPDTVGSAGATRGSPGVLGPKRSRFFSPQDCETSR